MCESLAMTLPRRILLLLALTFVTGCAHFSEIEQVPRSYRARLAKHPYWLTVTSFKNLPGVFPPSETSAIMRWEVKDQGGRAVVMRQVASSSLFGTMSKILQGNERAVVIDLTGEIDPEVFLPLPGHAAHATRPYSSDRYHFRDIDGKRFQILINGGIGRIVFTPVANNYFQPTDAKAKEPIGIWKTPFGAETELLDHFKKLVARERPDLAERQQDNETHVYLHHDVSVKRQIAVVSDRTFPEAFRPAISKAVKKWNAAFKKDLFVYEAKPKQVDHGDCLTGFKICVKWLGPPELAFTGANGYSEVSFDPQSGLIMGGVITVINDDVVTPLADLSPPERQRVVADALDWDWLADAMLRFNELNGKRHPLPEPYVEYLVLHEMGHMNGFGHNFYTRGETARDRPVSSVMSYPPFPVGHRANNITESDLARLRMVYDQKHAAQPPGYCSSMEAMTPERGDDGIYRKPASCDVFTLGDPADWYIRLAKHGRFGVFTGYPDLSHLSEELRLVYRDAARRRRLPPLNVLTRLGFILGDPDKANKKSREVVSNYLCSLATERLAISSQLQEFHSFDLRCHK